MGTHTAIRWVSFDVVCGSITTFLKDMKPSSTFAPEIEWLCVSRLRASKSEDNGTYGLMCAWQALCAAKKDQVTSLDVLRLAEEHNVKSGKWLIYVPSKAVDEAWSIVAGLLGNDAKVSTVHHGNSYNSDVVKNPKKVVGSKALSSKDDRSTVKCEEGSKTTIAPHVICVYSSDFNNIEEVFEVREKLAALGFKDKLLYKPDAYTFCGIYSENRWGIAPTIYSGTLQATMGSSSEQYTSMADFRRQKSACALGGHVLLWVAARIHRLEVNYATKEFTYAACSFVEEDGRVCSISDFRVARASRKSASPSPVRGKVAQTAPMPESHRCGLSTPFKRAWWFFVHFVDAINTDDITVEKCACFQAGSDLLGDPVKFEELGSVAAQVKHVKTLKGKLFRFLVDFSLPVSIRPGDMNLPRLVKVQPLDRVPHSIILESSDEEYADALEADSSSPTSTVTYEVDALALCAVDLSLAAANRVKVQQGKALVEKK